jgi:predicted nuclease of restriction endonuclease-like (RecB) superfamily
LYWNVGKRIKEEILGNERAEYGKEIVSALGRQLTTVYGTGFSEKSLWHMIHFAQVYPDEKIISALRRELSWTHFKEIIYIDDPLKRDFYAEMCRIERWNTRTLHAKIQNMLYERTALSKKSEKLIKQELAALREEDRMTPDLVFRDPYFLDFLGLSDTYSERDLEAAILRELERFLLELGTDFTFAARQKRITIDSEDYYLDLLFYHRSMRRLVAIELKLGKFQAQDKGQMELYLRWLDIYERREGEESPLGLILCAEKTAEHVELLQLETSGNRSQHVRFQGWRGRNEFP